MNPQGRTGNVKRAVGVAMIAVGCFSAVVLAMALRISEQAPVVEATNMIQGSVLTDEFGSRPVSITFTSQNEVMQLTAPIKNNHYDIELPSGSQSFEVGVTWNSLQGVFGDCYAGTVGYTDSNKPPLVQDFRC